MRRAASLLFAFALAGGAQAAFAPGAIAGPHDGLIAKHAAANGVPEQLVRRVIRAESGGNAAAVHAGNYGLMQIRLGTARGMGYAGDANGLLDPDTNLTYAVKYLAGAYRAAGCDADRAVSLYMRGYYGAAKRECAESPAEVTQFAQALAKNKQDKPKREIAPAKSKPDTPAVGPADVIKPKVVRTEIIATSKSAPAPARPAGAFEPARVTSQPSARPVEAAVAPSAVSPAPKADKLAPAPAQFELASVPLPPARRELDPPRKRDVQPARPAKRAPESPEKKSALASIGDPAAVVSFLKKLVTPDKKVRKRTAEAEAALPPPSQIQPPQ